MSPQDLVGGDRRGERKVYGPPERPIKISWKGSAWSEEKNKGDMRRLLSRRWQNRRTRAKHTEISLLVGWLHNLFFSDSALLRKGESERVNPFCYSLSVSA